MRRHSLRNIILIILAAIILLLSWGIFSSYHILSVTEYEVCSEKITGDVNFVLISDLHNHSFGRSNAALVKKIRKLDPDLILMAGDFLNADSPMSRMLLGSVISVKFLHESKAASPILTTPSAILTLFNP